MLVAMYSLERTVNVHIATATQGSPVPRTWRGYRPTHAQDSVLPLRIDHVAFSRSRPESRNHAGEPCSPCADRTRYGIGEQSSCESGSMPARRRANPSSASRQSRHRRGAVRGRGHADSAPARCTLDGGGHSQRCGRRPRVLGARAALRLLASIFAVVHSRTQGSDGMSALRTAVLEELLRQV